MLRIEAPDASLLIDIFFAFNQAQASVRVLR